MQAPTGVHFDESNPSVKGDKAGFNLSFYNSDDEHLLCLQTDSVVSWMLSECTVMLMCVCVCVCMWVRLCFVLSTYVCVCCVCLLVPLFSLLPVCTFYRATVW